MYTVDSSENKIFSVTSRSPCRQLGHASISKFSRGLVLISSLVSIIKVD